MVAVKKSNVVNFKRPIVVSSRRPMKNVRAAKVIRSIGGGKCALSCGRKCATYSKTGICTTCLSWLSKTRNETQAWRERYGQRLLVSAVRMQEFKDFPKGYRLGRLDKEVTQS
jgi:hypothetical protein